MQKGDHPNQYTKTKALFRTRSEMIPIASMVYICFAYVWLKLMAIVYRLIYHTWDLTG